MLCGTAVGGIWGLRYECHNTGSIIPPPYLFFVIFLLVAVIDRAIWRCLAFHLLWGCQWLRIKILYIGLIFFFFFFLITWPLHSASLSTIPSWVVSVGLSMSTPSELLYVSGYESQALTTWTLSRIFSWGHESSNTSLRLHHHHYFSHFNFTVSVIIFSYVFWTAVREGYSIPQSLS